MKLNVDEIEKRKLSLSYATADVIISFAFGTFFSLIIVSIGSTSTDFLIEKFGKEILVLLLMMFVIVPYGVMIGIQLILAAKEHFYKYSYDKYEKGMKVFSSLAFHDVPLILAIYFPTTIWELFLWSLTIFGLYVGFGKERAPLIRYGIDVYRLERLRARASEKTVRNVVSSFFCLIISILIIFPVASYRVYPVPFLLVFYFKYFFQRVYFNDYDSQKFYENWQRAENKLSKMCSWIIPISLFSSIIPIAIASIDIGAHSWLF